MVVAKEFVLVKQELAEVMGPKFALWIYRRIHLERYERLDAEQFHRLKVIFRRIGFIEAHLAHGKALHGLSRSGSCGQSPSGVTLTPVMACVTVPTAT